MKWDLSVHKNKLVPERHSKKENLDLSYNFPAKLDTNVTFWHFICTTRWDFSFPKSSNMHK